MLDFFPFFARFHRLAEAVPTSPKPEPTAKKKAAKDGQKMGHKWGPKRKTKVAARKRRAAHEAAEGEVAGVALAVAAVVNHGEGGRVGVAARVELGARVSAFEGRAAQHPLGGIAKPSPCVERRGPLPRSDQVRAAE